MEKVLTNKEQRASDSKPPNAVQHVFLDKVVRDKIPVMIFLISGIKLTGRIRAFDKFVVLLENDTSNNNQEQLIYKHGISTITFHRGAIRNEDRPLASALSSPD